MWLHATGGGGGCVRMGASSAHTLPIKGLLIVCAILYILFYPMVFASDLVVSESGGQGDGSATRATGWGLARSGGLTS